MTNFRAALLFWFALGCHSQDLKTLLEKAPPDIDEKLRHTVAQFYQAHVDGKFRLADEFVAEDSKDVFFAMEKRRYRSCAVSSIKYSDDFKYARVTTVCDTEMMMAMAGRIPVKMPIASRWKFLDGRWQWYVDPPDPNGKQTPFGGMKPRSADQPARTLPPPVTIETVTSLVKTDKKEVRLAAAAGWTDRVSVTNGSPGSVSLSLEGSAPGLEMKLEPTELGPGQSATLTIRFDPKASAIPTGAVARIVVTPTQQVLTVRIGFAPSGP